MKIELTIDANDISLALEQYYKSKGFLVQDIKLSHDWKTCAPQAILQLTNLCTSENRSSPKGALREWLAKRRR